MLDLEGEREVYVLQPKNSYHLRSLPNVIGTREWFSDDKIGLGDEDLEDGVAGDQETESESEEEDPQHDKKPDVESDYSDSENEDSEEEIDDGELLKETGTLADLLVGGCNKRGVDVLRKFPKVGLIINRNQVIFMKIGKVTLLLIDLEKYANMIIE